MRSTNQFAKVIDDVAVQPYGDPYLFGRQWDHRTSRALAEIVFSLHIRLSSYCARSRVVACRAEIMRMMLPCTAYDIAKTRPCASMPKVKYRSSHACSSGSVIARSSSNTTTASTNSTPCFRRLRSAFLASHSYSTSRLCSSCTVYTGALANNNRDALGHASESQKGALSLPPRFGFDSRPEQNHFRSVRIVRHAIGRRPRDSPPFTNARSNPRDSVNSQLCLRRRIALAF